MIRFNIVTPTFNDAHKYLIDTIAAVSGQIYDTSNIEVVHTIVDDGSDSIDALSFIERLSDSSLVNIVSQANCGLPAARNTAINSIQSDYILPLDSDDLIHPCLIQQFYDYLKACNFPTNAPNVVQGFPQVPYPMQRQSYRRARELRARNHAEGHASGQKIRGKRLPGQFQERLARDVVILQNELKARVVPLVS